MFVTRGEESRKRQNRIDQMSSEETLIDLSVAVCSVPNTAQAFVAAIAQQRLAKHSDQDAIVAWGIIGKTGSAISQDRDCRVHKKPVDCVRYRTEWRLLPGHCACMHAWNVLATLD